MDEIITIDFDNIYYLPIRTWLYDQYHKLVDGSIHFDNTVWENVLKGHNVSWVITDYGNIVFKIPAKLLVLIILSKSNG